MLRIELRPRNVVNAVPAVLDDRKNFLDAGFAAVVHFTSGTRPEAARIDRENQCLKEESIALVERTIDKDVVSRTRMSHLRLAADRLHGVVRLLNRNHAGL